MMANCPGLVTLMEASALQPVPCTTRTFVKATFQVPVKSRGGAVVGGVVAGGAVGGGLVGAGVGAVVAGAGGAVVVGAVVAGSGVVVVVVVGGALPVVVSRVVFLVIHASAAMVAASNAVGAGGVTPRCTVSRAGDDTTLPAELRTVTV